MKKFVFIICFFSVLANSYAQIIIPSKEVIKENCVIIDTRETSQYKKGHLNNSVNITNDEIKEIVTNLNFDELHNLAVLLGISKEKDVYIISQTRKDELILNMAFASMLDYMGINNVKIIYGEWEDFLKLGIEVTSKGRKIIPAQMDFSKKKVFLDKEDFKKLLKSKKSLVINLNSKLEKSNNVVNLNINSFFDGDFLKKCEEINKIIFTGKGKTKKDIILKSYDTKELLSLKYLLSKHCGCDNVLLFKEAN